MSNQFLDTIDRLSKKRGVIATLILDRQNTGSIIKSSSSPAFSRLFISKEGFEGGVNRTEDDERNMKDLAGMVWNHVESTERLVGALDSAVSLHFLQEGFRSD